MSARRLFFSIICAVGFLLPAMPAMALQQGDSVDVRIWTYDDAGNPVTDVCYELAGYSNVGCDENRDGNVLFQDIPFGNYTVQPVNPDGSASPEYPFQITVDSNNTDFVANIPGGSQPIQTTDVFLVTRDPQTGKSLTDVCYQLVGYSNIGCDENKDGRVLFQDIPHSAAYTIRQTKTPAGYPKMDDYIVSVMRGDANLPLSILLSQSKTQATGDNLNISVVFYDVRNGHPVGDADNCAQLRNGRDAASNVGCDENVIDGQVDFMNVDWHPNNTSATLRATPMCGYSIVNEPDLDILWVGQHTLLIFVPLEPSGEVCS